MFHLSYLAITWMLTNFQVHSTSRWVLQKYFLKRARHYWQLPTELTTDLGKVRWFLLVIFASIAIIQESNEVRISYSSGVIVTG